MLLPSSGSTNFVRFTTYKRAYINWPQHTPLTSTLNKEAVYSANMFVCTFNNTRCQEQGRPQFRKNSPLLIIYYCKIQMPCCYFQQRCTYQYGSTDSFVLYIRVISHTDVNKQNLNSRALIAQPICISRYQCFINKTEIAVALTENWGELSDLSVVDNSPTRWFTWSFLTYISTAL